MTYSKKQMRYLLIFIFPIFLLGCASNEENGVYNLDSDLSNIVDTIEDYEVIVLAEPTHASSDIDEIFIKLITQLTKDGDYNVVGLETSSAELEYYLNFYDESNLDIVRNESVMEKYTQPNFSSLFKKHWNNELSVEGIDWVPTVYNQTTDNTHLLENIYQDIKKSNIENAEDFKNKEIKLREFTSRMIFNDEEYIDYDEVDSYLNFYKNLKNSSSYEDLDPHSKKFINHRIDVLQNPLSKEYLTGLKITNPNQDYFSRRGIGMYEKINNLVKEGNKVIVWVHNWHALKNPGKINIPSEEGQISRPTDHYSLGYLLNQSNLKTFVIGTYFNSAENFSSIYLNNEDLEKITDEKFLEAQLSYYQESPLFINLEQHKLLNNRYNAYDEGFIEYELNPREQFDGLIYIEEITN